MNAKQKRKVIELLKSDCQVRHEYFIPRRGTCAIGCLGLAAGVSKQTLERAGGESIDCYWNKSVKRLAQRIQKKFGLTLEQQRKIQSVNDNHCEQEYRRKAVIGLVRQWRAT